MEFRETQRESKSAPDNQTRPGASKPLKLRTAASRRRPGRFSPLFICVSSSLVFFLILLFLSHTYLSSSWMLGKVLRLCYQIKLVLRPELLSRLSAEKKKKKRRKLAESTAGRPAAAAEAASPRPCSLTLSEKLRRSVDSPASPRRTKTR